MKILKLKRLQENIYQLTYYNFWGLYRCKKVFPYFFGWRFLHNGKQIKHDNSTAIEALSKGLKIGDSIFTKID